MLCCPCFFRGGGQSWWWVGACECWGWEASGVPITPAGYSVKCEYSAHKEGVLKEEMLLACEGGTGICVRVMVQARVMGESERRGLGCGEEVLAWLQWFSLLPSEREVLALSWGSQPPWHVLVSPSPSRAWREVRASPWSGWSQGPAWHTDMLSTLQTDTTAHPCCWMVSSVWVLS